MAGSGSTKEIYSLIISVLYESRDYVPSLAVVCRQDLGYRNCAVGKFFSIKVDGGQSVAYETLRS